MGVDEFIGWLRDAASTLHENAAYLTELDSAIGDADHGANMDRGFQAIVAVLDETSFGSVDELMKKAGMTLVSKVGGASGPLYGTFFLRPGSAGSSSAARRSWATRPCTTPGRRPWTRTTLPWRADRISPAR
jgi:dihydroxyacetone kinase-like protein